jgi:hypothetical protein
MQQYSRQHVIDLLNRLGYTQLAEEASRVLPDPVDADQVSTWGMQHGLSRDDLISPDGWQSLSQEVRRVPIGPGLRPGRGPRTGKSCL